MKYSIKKEWKVVVLLFTIACMSMFFLCGNPNTSSANQSKSTYKKGNISNKKLSFTIKKNTSKVTNKNVIVSVSLPNKRISVMKWAKGKKKGSYFKTKGNKILLKNRKASLKVSTNGIYTFYGKDKVGNSAIRFIKVSNIDRTAPKIILQQKANGSKTRVNIVLNESIKQIQKVLYYKGNVKNKKSVVWKNKANIVKNKRYFDVTTKAGTYSIMVIDKAGNCTIRTITIGKKEMRAVWVSFLEFGNAQVSNMSENQFKTYINTMFSNIVKLKMNTVIVQVRPYADAMYVSSYFPASRYAVGKEGNKMTYDPLKYMVQAAHSRNLEIHAWINPYRISATSAKISSLSKKNQARKWREAKNNVLNRNVLTFSGGLYYNPAKQDVKKLIVNGVKEIVKKYDVDGIHFDDYFYPALGENYKKNFDAKEYNTYKKNQEKNDLSPMGIIQWRRNNVDTLVREVYKAVKAIDSKVEFGISPAGSLENLYTKDRYYCDVKKWMGKDGYLDYICPQIYWSFQQTNSPFAKTLLEWNAISKSSNVDLYIGIAAYRAGVSMQEAKLMNDLGWANKTAELKKQVTYARQTGKVNGFMFYRYENLISDKAKKEINNLKSILY